MQRSRKMFLSGVVAAVALTTGAVGATASTSSVAGTAASTSTSTADGFSKASSAKGVRHLVLDFNMAGQSKNQGRLGVADEVARSIINRPAKVRAATLQEVCGSQANRIRERLKNRGYHVRFAPTPANIRCKGGSKYGNAVVYRGKAEFSRVYALPHLNDGHKHQKRNMVCVALDKSAVAVCSTHIDHKHVDIKFKQIPFVAKKAKALQNAGHAVIVGGDFNQQPHRDSMDFMYHPRYGGGAKGLFLEGAGCCKRKSAPTKDNGDKLDYLFGAAKYFTADGARAVASKYSDHHRYWATFVRR